MPALNQQHIKKMKSNALFLRMLWALLVLGSIQATAQDRFGGVTLYTLRGEMGQHPMETLQAVADLGYKFIEAAGYQDGKYYGLAPEEFKKAVQDLGMEPLSTHQASITLDNADKEFADAKAAGFKYFVIPVPPMGHFTYNRETQSLAMSEDLDVLVDIFTQLANKANKAGLTLLYHNHNFEFETNSKGQVPYDYFLEHMDPKLMNFQIDLYWATKAGVDPVAYFEKYPGRFKIWHMKDMDDQGRFAPVGTGSIDFAKLLESKEKAGMEFYVVEQDQTFDGMRPLESAAISHQGLKKAGYK
ncbi:MAG: sugar phosphate isomerase/epimerase [Bacteroidales bacterium]